MALRYVSRLPLLATSLTLGIALFAAFACAQQDGASSTVQRVALQRSADAKVGPHDWPQWGGSSVRNNTPEGKNIPSHWEVGEFNRKTGEWIPGTGENIKWVARLGSQSYGNPVVANGQVYL